MKKIFLLIAFIASLSQAAISTATKPHVIDSAATPRVSYVDDNDEALLDKIQEVIDTVNLHNSSGAIVGSVISSTGDMRQTIDSDNNGTNRWFVTANGATDTLLRILEDHTWAAYGAGVGTKLTLSDSILAATARISGNGTFGGTLGVTGASTLAALTATTGTYSGNLTLSVLSSGRIPVVSTAGLITQDNLYWDATNDRLGVGSGASSPATDFDLTKGTAGTATVGRIYNTDNTNTASNAILQLFAGGASGGDPFVRFNINGATDWSIGPDNSDADALVITPSTTPGGATNGLRISTAGAVTIPGTLGVTGLITGSVSGNAATVTTNANLTGPITSVGNATSVASQTGTGSTFMMSASPTTTGTLTAAAITASGAVSTGALTATSVTIGGGEAFAYGDTTFTLTATGMTTSPTGTAKATRVGKMITMQIPFIQGTSNSSALTLTGVPSGWRPNIDIGPVPFGQAQNNGIQVLATDGLMVMIEATGTLRFYRSGSTTGWTNSGTKGVCFDFTSENVITYLAQ